MWLFGTSKTKKLRKAVEQNDLELLQTLLNDGVDPECRYNSEMTILSFAAKQGNANMVSALLKKGAAVNSKENYTGETALMIAATEGNVEAARTLINNGADVSLKDDWGDGALFLATRAEQVEVVKLLLENGADVNLAGEDFGLTPLMAAAEGNMIEIIKILLKNYADKKVAGPEGVTAFDIANEYNYVKAARMLEWEDKKETEEISNEMDKKISKTFQEYGEFLKYLSQKDLSGPLLDPQLILVLKTAEMANRLLEGFPASADSLIGGGKELFEFGDGTAAACFPMKTGSGILQMFELFGQGDYGSKPLRITNGIAIRLPIADRQTLRETVNSENLFGIGRPVEDEDFWWW